MGMRVRLALVCLAFALSVLVILPAPSLPFWLITIGVTEWGHWLALGMLVLLASELYWGRNLFRLISSTLCLVAMVLFSLPVLEAIPIARQLPGDLSAAYGPRPNLAMTSPAPLQLTKLWGRRRPAGINRQALHYLSQDGTSLPLDFFSNETPDKLPCIIVVHGGAWHSGDEKELETWNPIFASLGYRVASIAYRLAPDHHWPAQKQDLAAAIAYLKSNAGQLGIDPNRLILLGRSAGAQIVLATAYSLHDDAIRGCIASYPPTDMDFDYGPAALHSILNAHQVISQFLGGTPAQIPDIYHDASPLQLAGPDAPPTLLAQGTRDEIVWIENSRKLRDRLSQLHRPVYLLEMPWATHGFDANPSGPGGQLELYAITWFLGTILNEPAGKTLAP
jgi:acetyl esterase/lipase